MKTNKKNLYEYFFFEIGQKGYVVEIKHDHAVMEFIEITNLMMNKKNKVDSINVFFKHVLSKYVLLFQYDVTDIREQILKINSREIWDTGLMNGVSMYRHTSLTILKLPLKIVRKDLSCFTIYVPRTIDGEDSYQLYLN